MYQKTASARAYGQWYIVHNGPYYLVEYWSLIGWSIVLNSILVINLDLDWKTDLRCNDTCNNQRHSHNKHSFDKPSVPHHHWTPPHRVHIHPHLYTLRDSNWCPEPITIGSLVIIKTFLIIVIIFQANSAIAFKAGGNISANLVGFTWIRLKAFININAFKMSIPFKCFISFI